MDDELLYSAGQIEQLLKCAVCLDRFTNPKILPCQHTFCSTPCLEGLVHPITRYIKCPECRAEHRVPYEGIRGFPNNITIQGFLDLRSQRNQNRHQEQTGGAIGQVDQGYHRVNTTAEAAADAASAYINAVVDEQTPAVAAASRSGCAVCGREAFLARCDHCDMIVCVSCQNSHTEQIKLDIVRLTGQIRRGLPTISNAISSIERKSTQIRQRTEAIKSDISEATERYMNEIRNRQRLLHGEVEMFLQGETRSLSMHVENLEVEIASISSFSDTTDSSLARSQANIPIQDLVDIRRQCVEYMEALRGYENGNFEVPRERYLQFIVEENRLLNAITNYGEVVISNVPPESATPSREESPQDAPASQSTPIVTSSPAIPVSSTITSVMTSTPSSISTSWAPSMEAVDRAIALIRSGGRDNFQTPSPGRSLTPEFRPLPPNGGTTHRRSLQERRRHHMTDSRIAGLLSGSAPSVYHRTATQPRRQRSLTTGATLMDIQGASGFYQRPIQHSIEEEEPAHVYANARSRTFEEEEGQEPGHQLSRVNSAEARLRSRPAVRFDINGSGDSDSGEEPIMNLQRVSFQGNESTMVSEAINNYQDKGRAIIRFGTRGSDEMQFTWPRGVAVSGRDNTILVADSSNHRVHVFDSVGRFIKTFGSYGQSDGEFDCLAGVAVNTFGQIITSDRYNHRIQVFDHNGTFQHMFGEEGVDNGQLLYPWGVACDKMGFIYICDKENHRVQVFQANGSFVRKLGGLGHRFGQMENPHYLAISPDNRIYVSDSSNHRIQIFSMYGDFLFSFGSPGTMQGQVKFPKGIAIDDQGFVVVADSGNNRIQVFHGDGRFYCMFGTYGSGNGQFKGLEGVAILANGNVVVSDRENHRIQIF
ncbi:RING finger protein nhl-1-like [Mytilus galloprovincialis]|uniref:RING finger protein nhl-1-like n=1 Tax=Mytilus galloprovincialis TaxID=29158 RepID=UPI003F7CB354